MNKLAFVGFLTISAVLAQGPPPDGRFGRGPGFGPGGPGMRTVAGAPYTGTEVSTSSQTLSNGNVITRQNSTNIARDGQGRVRSESTMKHPDGTTSTHVMIHDPVAGVIHNLDPERKVSNDQMLHAAPNGRGRGPGGPRGANNNPDIARGAGRGPGRGNGGPAHSDPNVTTENLGVQMINGVQATGTRITHTIPAGAEGNTLPIVSVHETWNSEDLKVPVRIKTVDPRFGTTTTELTNVVRAEPDATLFQVPAGYTVSKGGPGRGGPRGGGPKQ